LSWTRDKMRRESLEVWFAFFDMILYNKCCRQLSSCCCQVAMIHSLQHSPQTFLAASHPPKFLTTESSFTDNDVQGSRDIMAWLPLCKLHCRGRSFSNELLLLCRSNTSVSCSFSWTTWDEHGMNHKGVHNGLHLGFFSCLNSWKWTSLAFLVVISHEGWK